MVQLITETIKLLTDTTDQIADVVLSGNPYTLRVLWNERHGYWSLSIFERDGAAIVENIKMVKDYPLIGRFKNLLLPPGELYFIDPKTRPGRPGYDAFTDHYLTYLDLEEVAAVSASILPAGQLDTIWDGGVTSFDGGVTSWDA